MTLHFPLSKTSTMDKMNITGTDGLLKKSRALKLDED
jgi:hypothetical protein